jgi:hypothetical protein
MNDHTAKRVNLKSICRRDDKATKDGNRSMVNEPTDQGGIQQKRASKRIRFAMSTSIYDFFTSIKLLLDFIK